MALKVKFLQYFPLFFPHLVSLLKVQGSISAMNQRQASVRWYGRPYKNCCGPDTWTRQSQRFGQNSCDDLMTCSMMFNGEKHSTNTRNGALLLCMCSAFKQPSSVPALDLLTAVFWHEIVPHSFLYCSSSDICFGALLT